MSHSTHYDVLCEVDIALENMIKDFNLRKQTAFIDDKTTVVVARQFKPTKRTKGETFIVTVGKPNFINRKRTKSKNIYQRFEYYKGKPETIFSYNHQ